MESIENDAFYARLVRRLQQAQENKLRNQAVSGLERDKQLLWTRFEQIDAEKNPDQDKELILSSLRRSMLQIEDRIKKIYEESNDDCCSVSSPSWSEPSTPPLPLEP